ncbi:unnamed protein product, partial [Closterium sp. NIES-65]
QEDTRVVVEAVMKKNPEEIAALSPGSLSDPAVPIPTAQQEDTRVVVVEAAMKRNLEEIGGLSSSPSVSLSDPAVPIPTTQQEDTRVVVEAAMKRNPEEIRMEPFGIDANNHVFWWVHRGEMR